jgi:hypothetical protein
MGVRHPILVVVVVIVIVVERMSPFRRNFNDEFDKERRPSSS